MMDRVLAPGRWITTMALLLSMVGMSAGCTEDDSETWYLGEIAQPDATPSPESGVDGGSMETVARGETNSCETPPVPVTEQLTRASVHTLGQRAILVTDHAVRALGLDSDGCPERLITQFGDQGTLQRTALDALPLSANRVLLSTVDGFRITDATGVEIATCTEDGSLKARVLSRTGDSAWAAISLSSPIESYGAPTGSTSACHSQGSSILTPAPHLVTTFTALRDGSWATAEQVSETSALRVAHYSHDGKLLGSWEGAPPSERLCSAVQMTSSPAGLWVVDGACRKVVLVRTSDMVPIVVTNLEDVPLGASWITTANRLLVATARSSTHGDLVEFETIAPPTKTP